MLQRLRLEVLGFKASLSYIDVLQINMYIDKFFTFTFIFF